MQYGDEAGGDRDVLLVDLTAPIEVEEHLRHLDPLLRIFLLPLLLLLLLRELDQHEILETFFEFADVDAAPDFVLVYLQSRYI